MPGRSCTTTRGRCSCRERLSACGGEQEAATRSAAARADDGSLGVLHLPFAGVAAELSDGFVEEAVAVQATGRQLAAVRVEWEQTVTRDVRATGEEVLGLAPAAEPERLDPRQAV